FHVHTWGLPFSCMLSGMKYVLPGRYDFNQLPSTIDKEKVTFTASVPSILYMLLASPGLHGHEYAMKGLKSLIGGASLPTGLAARAAELGIVVVGAYGLSETCPALTISTYTPQIEKLPNDKRFLQQLKAGVPFPLVELRLVDSNMKDVPHDGSTTGEIIVRAPWCTGGYFKDEEKSAKLWEGGWLHTGDLGVIDEYGYLQVVDREKDAVKSGGEFIPALLVESAISELRGVGEVAIVGVKDEKWGERPVAVATRVSAITEQDVMEHLLKFVETGRMQKWWLPDRIIFVDNLPKTSTGKADKKEIRKMVSLS
ncbi:MAG: AMP-binding protein, partial [Methanomassiliicoccales archaeon]